MLTLQAVQRFTKYKSFLDLALTIVGATDPAEPTIGFAGQELLSSQVKAHRTADGALALEIMAHFVELPDPASLRLRIEVGPAAGEFDFATMSAAYTRRIPPFLLVDPPGPRVEDLWRARLNEGSGVLLDIGGRARSGISRKGDYPAWEVRVLDIVEGEDVDLVGDAHDLSMIPTASIDAIQSVAVFEHLQMPWAAILEMNRVLKPGGLVLTVTHQTVGMHDRPWDFYRYSMDAWPGLFSAVAGFEVVATEMTELMRIIPHFWSHRFAAAETDVGYYASRVLARKVGEASVGWRGKPNVTTAYPG